MNDAKPSLTRPTTLAIEFDGTRDVLPFSFSAEEFALLDMYVEQCDALWRCTWIQDGHGVSLSLSYNEGKTALSVKAPPDDVVAALLHRVRPFLLQKEPASFFRIASLVGARLTHPLLREHLARLRKQFRGEDATALMKVTATAPDPSDPTRPLTAIVNSFDTFLDWLNSYEYHRDLDKRERLDALTQQLTHDGARAIFLGLLTEVVRGAFGLGNLVRVLTGHDSRVEALVNRPVASDAKGPASAQSNSTP